MAYPTQREMELNMMTGKGRDLGIKRTASAAIPKQVYGGPTKTSDGNKNFDVKKKMTKIMKRVTKG
jgi:hypothetical protein